MSSVCGQAFPSPCQGRRWTKVYGNRQGGPATLCGQGWTISRHSNSQGRGLGKVARDIEADLVTLCQPHLVGNAELNAYTHKDRQRPRSPRFPRGPADLVDPIRLFNQQGHSNFRGLVIPPMTLDIFFLKVIFTGPPENLGVVTLFE